VKLLFPADASTPADRLAFVHRVRERLRRRNNELAAGHFATDAKARRWHREWFRPRNALLTEAELELRGRLFGHTVAGDSEKAEAPWTAPRRRIEALADAAPELAAVALTDAFQGGLAPAELPDPKENFTTYTEVDPSSRLTVAANLLTATSLHNNETAYVYADKGAAHFAAAWEHDVDFRVTALGGGALGFWDLANTVTHCYDQWGRHLEAVYAAVGIATNRFSIRSCKNATIDYYYPSIPYVNTWFYFTLERTSETACEMRVYSNPARTLLLATRAIALVSGERHRYVYGATSYKDATSVWLSAEIANLDLHEGAAGLPIPVAANHYRQMGTGE
jgi:hypothetical protein